MTVSRDCHRTNWQLSECQLASARRGCGTSPSALPSNAAMPLGHEPHLRRSPFLLIRPLLCLGLTGLISTACIGSSSTPQLTGASVAHQMAGHQLMVTITGRVWTRACGGPVGAAGCGPTSYRGELVFCRSMSEKGICPAAKVDAWGRFRIALPRAGRWALIPAPGNGNVVFVKPRWVAVRLGRTTVVHILGGNLMMERRAPAQSASATGSGASSAANPASWPRHARSTPFTEAAPTIG
jgi:hypothetical protein